MPRSFQAAPSRSAGRPPVAAKFQFSSRAGQNSLVGIVIFGMLVAAFRMFSTHRPMVTPPPPTVVFPNIVPANPPQVNNTWPQVTPQITPAIPMNPAYPVTPPTLYRPQPPVTYRELPEKPYHRIESH